MNFVRIASDGDATAIATLQCDTWRHDFPDLFTGPAGADLEPELVADRWRPVLRGQLPGFVVVATDDTGVVGFAAAEVRDETAQIHALLVAAGARRRGHGSRLMSACADLVQQDGAREAVMWCLKDDHALADFLVSAGWASDGGSRDLSDDHTVVREIRYTTTFAGPFHTHGR